MAKDKKKNDDKTPVEQADGKLKAEVKVENEKTPTPKGAASPPTPNPNRQKAIDALVEIVVGKTGKDDDTAPNVDQRIRAAELLLSHTW